MSVRLYLCPIIGDGINTETAFRAKLSGMVNALLALIPNKSSTDGTPQFTFAFCAARSQDWTAVDADATLDKLFDTADVPDTVNDWPSLKAWLQSKTVGDLSAARRQALNTKLTSYGFDTSQVKLTTTLWQVIIGMCNQMGYSGADVMALV